MNRDEFLQFVLDDRIDVTARLAVFRLSPSRRDAGLPPFRAGQHLSVSVPGASGEWSRRPLSIASAPEESRWLEFLVSRSGGEADPFVERFWALERGGTAQVASRGEGRLLDGERGFLAGAGRAVFVASGTGVAPFASAIRSWAARGDLERLEKTSLLHGVSRPGDLAYRGLFRQHLGPSRYLPTVSRPEVSDRWGGSAGRVETLLAPGRIQETERLLGWASGSLRPEEAAVFVCGFPESVIAVESALAPRGFRRGAGLFTEE